MSGLVSGLQNHVRRFESARYLKKSDASMHHFFVYILTKNHKQKKIIFIFVAHLQKLGGYAKSLVNL